MKLDNKENMKSREKYWDELNTDEKTEKTHSVIERLLRQIADMHNRIDTLERRHSKEE
jgi:hypothetical protein